MEPAALHLSAMSFSGKSIYRREVTPPVNDRDRLEDLLAAEVRTAIDACASRDSGPLLGVGVGIAGLVNAREGVVLYCPGLPGLGERGPGCPAGRTGSPRR